MAAASLALGGTVACESTATGGAPPGGPATFGRGTSTAATASATSAPTTPSPTRVATPTSSPSACRAGQLAIRLTPLPGAAAGTTYADITLTNGSRDACTVTGSVAVAVLDQAGHPIQIPVAADPPGHPLTLTPGGAATQTLAYASDGIPPCPATEAAYAVTPPDSTAATTIQIHPRPACPDDRITLSTPVPGTYSPPG